MNLRRLKFLTLVFNLSVIFPDDPNPFIQQRANTVKSTVPEAIFRAATQVANGPQATFDLANGFLDLTSKVYVGYFFVFCSHDSYDGIRHNILLWRAGQSISYPQIARVLQS